MTNPLKVAAGKKGGFRKWAKITSKKRSAMMRKVALARWSVALLEKK